MDVSLLGWNPLIPICSDCLTLDLDICKTSIFSLRLLDIVQILFCRVEYLKLSFNFPFLSIQSCCMPIQTSITQIVLPLESVTKGDVAYRSRKYMNKGEDLGNERRHGMGKTWMSSAVSPLNM